MAAGETGDRIGPYELHGELGRGGMGVVYRAVDTVTGETVALKVLGGDGDTVSPEAAARFQRESRIAAELDHPGIVPVLHTGTDGERAWFAMPCIEGESLAAALLHAEYSWREALELMRAVADALAAAHARGVLHRDVKPSNILLGTQVSPEPEAGGMHSAAAGHGSGQSETPSVFLTDFGLAKDTATDSKYTRTGQTLGTPAYMSPEQARGDLADLTPASDVWALGAVCYELLAGRPAFEGDTPAAVIGAVITSTPRPLDGVPRPVRRLVASALAKNPAHRPADAGEFRDECDRVLAGGAPRTRAPRRWTAPALAITAAVAGVAVLVPVLWPRPVTRSSEAAPPDATAQRAAALAQRGWEARHVDLAEATQLLQQALELGGEQPLWRLRLGLVRWTQGDPEGAAAEWATVPAGCPEHADARLYTGLLAYFDIPTDVAEKRRRKLAVRPILEEVARGTGEAARLARAALLADEFKDAEAAELLKGMDRWEAAFLRAPLITGSGVLADDPAMARRAIAELTRGIDSGMRFVWVYMNRANLHTIAGDPAAAAADFDTALELFPDHPLVLFDRASFRQQQGRREGAMADINRLIELHPTAARAYTRRGWFLVTSGKPAEGLEELDRAADLGDDSAELHHARGQALRDLGRPGAIEAFTAALERNPARGHTYYLRGALHGDLGRPQQSLEDALNAIKHGYVVPGAWTNACRAAGELGRHTEALGYGAKALELDPKFWKAHDARGHVFLKLQDTQNAIDEFSRCIDIAPEEPYAYHMRAQLYAYAEQLEPALADWRVFEKLVPNHPAGPYNAADLLMRLQRWGEAASALERYLKLEPNGRNSDAARTALAQCRRLAQRK